MNSPDPEKKIHVLTREAWIKRAVLLMAGGSALYSCLILAGTYLDLFTGTGFAVFLSLLTDVWVFGIPIYLCVVRPREEGKKELSWGWAFLAILLLHFLTAMAVLFWFGLSFGLIYSLLHEESQMILWHP